MSEQPALRFEVDGRIAVLTIDRPLFGNSVNGGLAGELAAAWRRLEADPALHVGVLTGKGEKDFCLGADMYEMAEYFRRRSGHDDTGQEPIPGLVAASESLRRLTKPLICAVNGRCAGIGLNFIAESDVVIGTERSAFSDPHVSWGGMSSSALARFLGRIPLDQLMRLALLGKGEWLGARRAYELGLLGELVESDQLLTRAKTLAKVAAEVNQPAVRAQKVSMRRAIESFHGPAVAAAREYSGKFAQETARRDIAAGTSEFVQARPLTNEQQGV